jgi:hypothetical protein
VGATAAYAIVMRGVAREVVLVDVDARGNTPTWPEAGSLY